MPWRARGAGRPDAAALAYPARVQVVAVERGDRDQRPLTPALVPPE